MKNLAFIKFLPTIVVATFLLSAFAKPESATPTTQSYQMSIGDVDFDAEIALSDGEKARGLMFRETLPENSGMIFVYETPRKASFWMKNTFVKLDIGFFTADGTLTQVRNMYPRSLDSVQSARDDIAYCIEMNYGWFKKNNIYPPAKLDMKKLLNAIESKKKCK